MLPSGSPKRPSGLLVVLQVPGLAQVCWAAWLKACILWMLQRQPPPGAFIFQGKSVLPSCCCRSGRLTSRALSPRQPLPIAPSPEALEAEKPSFSFWSRLIGASLVARWRRIHLPVQANVSLWVWSLGREDPLEEEMVTHSSILAWRIPWTGEPGRLWSVGSHRVGHD